MSFRFFNFSPELVRDTKPACCKTTGSFLMPWSQLLALFMHVFVCSHVCACVCVSMSEISAGGKISNSHLLHCHIPDESFLPSEFLVAMGLLAPLNNELLLSEFTSLKWVSLLINGASFHTWNGILNVGIDSFHLLDFLVIPKSAANGEKVEIDIQMCQIYKYVRWEVLTFLEAGTRKNAVCGVFCLINDGNNSLILPKIYIYIWNAVSHVLLHVKLKMTCTSMLVFQMWNGVAHMINPHVFHLFGPM